MRNNNDYYAPLITGSKYKRNSNASLNDNEGGFLNYFRRCLICEEKISFEEKEKIKMPCNHNFCLECWENYLDERVKNGNVQKISCMKKGCANIIRRDFIKTICLNNQKLYKKYEKFLQKIEILEKDKNVKFCPFPDCDGYGKKNDKDDKFVIVKCNYGHKFCFNCLQEPHGKKKCKQIFDQKFEEWRKSKIVKRCPKCKMWTEKNDGCNHMTCPDCHYQWCWLCQEEYKPDHYKIGKCNGLQFAKEDDPKVQGMLENKVQVDHLIDVNDVNIEDEVDDNLINDDRKKCCSCSCKCSCKKFCKIIKFILKEFFIMFFFTIFSNYFYFCKKAKTDIKNECIRVVYLLSVVPAFLIYELVFICSTLIIMIPGFLLFKSYGFLYLDVRRTLFVVRRRR